MGRFRWELWVGALGLALLILGHGLGLFWAPREAMMGEVGRILYVHVPTAWVMLVVYLISALAAAGSLWTGRSGWDAAVEASVEVGTLLGALVMIQGSIWAKPTWGVWWTWDPRLTTMTMLFFSYLGVILLRSLMSDPGRRLVATAVTTILASINGPITYMSVKWWNSLHQVQSTPETVDSPMKLALRIAAFGMLFLAIGLIGARWRIAIHRLRREEAQVAALPDTPTPLSLNTGRTP